MLIHSHTLVLQHSSPCKTAKWHPILHVKGNDCLHFCIYPGYMLASEETCVTSICLLFAFQAKFKQLWFPNHLKGQFHVKHLQCGNFLQHASLMPYTLPSWVTMSLKKSLDRARDAYQRITPQKWKLKQQLPFWPEASTHEKWGAEESTALLLLNHILTSVGGRITLLHTQSS